ncbi:MAG TPA: hypothetical protein VFZ91_10065 [Allosphingosinicella sp.]
MTVSTVWRCTRAAVWAVAALLAAQPGSVAAKPGDNARRADNKLAYEAMDEAFICMMKRNPGQVRAYLASVPGSDRERTIGWYLYRRLGDCLVRATYVRFNGVMARGVAAERLLATDFATADALQEPVGADEFGPLSEAMKLEPQIASGYAFARCVAMADPAGVGRVLSTARGSTAEQAAMQVLKLRFPPCVVAGATFSIDRWTLRPFLAEALYQVYRARGGAAANPGDRS